MPTTELQTITLPSGLRLEVATTGRGPAILFLHGFTDSWRSFEPILPRLPGDVRAIAFSQRGHGMSGRPAAGYRIADFAADAVALMDAAGIAEATVVGHSMGSLVAQELALVHPARVSRLVLIGSATAFDNPLVRELQQAVLELTDPIPPEFARSFQASTVYAPIPDALLDTVTAESLKVPARIWRDALAGILEFQSRARLPRLTMPTLIVRGAHDEIATREEDDQLRTAIRGARSLGYPDAGHAPHWEHPQRFADDLVAFVRQPTKGISSPSASGPGA